MENDTTPAPVRGRPIGSRNQRTMLVETLIAGDAEAITKVVTDAAKAGDLTAAKLCLERIAPAAKGRLLNFELPAVEQLQDVPLAHYAILHAIASGHVTADEGKALADIVDRLGAALDASSTAARLAAIEHALGIGNEQSA